MRNPKNKGGTLVDVELNVNLDQPRLIATGDMEVISVDTVSIMGSQGATASVGSVAAYASAGSVASAAGVTSRASFASEAAQVSLANSASYGAVTSISSQAFVASRAFRASRGSVGGVLQPLQAIPAVVSIAGPCIITLPDMDDAENLTLIKKGATGSLAIRTGDGKLLNGIVTRSMETEHQVDFLIPNGVDWTAKT